jgi:hypothetical protein
MSTTSPIPVTLRNFHTKPYTVFVSLPCRVSHLQDLLYLESGYDTNVTLILYAGKCLQPHDTIEQDMTDGLYFMIRPRVCDDSPSSTTTTTSTHSTSDVPID